MIDFALMFIGFNLMFIGWHLGDIKRAIKERKNED